MKRENCVQVKNVNKLSIPYLTRFFGSVGPIVKVQKDDISKFVTIEFANKTSVDRVFRFEGRILDECPIKIKKLKQLLPFQTSQTLEFSGLPKQKSKLNFIEEAVCSDGSQEEMWLLIHNQIKPHHFEESEHLLTAMFIWCLVNEISNDAKHLIKYHINMRSSYLKLELQKQIIERIIRKNKNSVAITDCLRSVTFEWKNSEALAWFSVPYPNIEEEQSKVEAASLLTKCIAAIRTYLSLRISEIMNDLNAASLCFNLEETGIEELITFKSQVLTSADDSFIGIVQNLGSKDIFFQFLAYQHPNSCIFLKQNKILGVFQCTLRLKCPPSSQLRDTNWCQLYKCQLWRKTVAGDQKIFYLKQKQRIQSIKLGEQTLVFENAQFSYQGMEKQIRNFKYIDSTQNLQIVFIAKQTRTIFQDAILQIQNEVQQNSTSKVKTQIKSQPVPQTKTDQQLITWINLIQIKSQYHTDRMPFRNIVNNLKLTHYLLQYIEESVTSKGLIIASKEMAIKLASNIIERQKDQRLFEFAHKKFDKYIGEQLWRLYNSQGERKVKNLLTKYSLDRK